MKARGLMLRSADKSSTLWLERLKGENAIAWDMLC